MAVGEFAGRLVGLALVFLLFAAPVLALLMASLYGGIWLSRLFGLGSFIAFVFFWLFVALIGVYVSPFVQPQIRSAMTALLDEPKPDNHPKE